MTTIQRTGKQMIEIGWTLSDEDTEKTDFLLNIEDGEITAGVIASNGEEADSGYTFDFDSTIADLVAAGHLVKTYDIVFNDSEARNNKGFMMNLEDAKAYIDGHNGTQESYFADYKGGIVSVICNETGQTEYEVEIH